MVFGIMAFGAPGADAEVGARWLVLNTKGEVKEGSTLHAQLALKKDVLLVLHTEILKVKVLLLCQEVKAINAFLQKEGTIAKEFNAEGKPVGSQILFSSCIIHLNGGEAPECTPTDPVDGKGFIVSKPLHFVAELHELTGGVKDDIILVLPDVGNEIIRITLPAACPIGTAIPVIGKLALKDCQELALVHLVEHLLEPFAPLTKLFSISETVEHASTLLGSMWAFLTGEHLGLKWSISNL
jgi:hypothetical protein